VTGSLTLMMMISLISAVSFSGLKTANFWREHSNDVLATVQTFLTDLFSIQGNARDYAFSGQSAALKTFQDSVNSAPKQLARLKLLTPDNPEQEERLRRISSDLDEVIAYSKQPFASSDNQGIAPAIRFESNGQVMASINRTLVDLQAFTSEERRLLDERSRKAEVDFQNTERLLIFGSILAGLLVVLANILTGRAMSAMRRAHEQLREQAAVLELGQVFVRDMDNRIVQWNSGAERLYGFSKEEALGRVSHELFHTEFPESLAQIDETLRRTDRWEGELVHCKHNGEPLTVVSQWVLHRDPGGNPARILEVDIDTTERTRAQKALELRNLDLQQVAYIASHDLKTPLRTISGFVELVQVNYSGKLDARGADWIRRASEGAHRLEARIDNLLLYSRLDSRAEPFEPVDCQVVLKEVLEGLEVVIQETDADITAGELPTVMGDPTQLVQLFENLIANGIKYRSASRPRIHISTERENGEWVFSVADNGIGIEAKHHERVFELFRRLHTQNAYPGDGLGLTLCRRIVGRHGGRIWLESELGKGCTVFFTISY
jgi:PAS domain S-box-containing protein